MTKSRFKEAMSLLTSGVSILTCRDQDNNCGITISSLSSVGLNPPTLLVCVDSKSSMIHAIRRSRRFGVTILAEEQKELGIRFANPSLSSAQRFDGTPFEMINDCPLILGGLAKLSCDLDSEVTVSENAVFFGLVTHVEAHIDTPLVYFHRQWRRLD